MLSVLAPPVFGQTSLLSQVPGKSAIGLGLELNRPVSQNERNTGNYVETLSLSKHQSCA